MEHTTEEIYEILKDKIVKLEYAPSQVLNEQEIADEFNVSRTPIRKVFQLLEADKLINIVPRFGVQVTTIDFRSMKHIFEITRVLDPYAAVLAVDRINASALKELEEIVDGFKKYDISKDYQNAISDDQRFHEIIQDSCGNTWLQDILNSLHSHTERLWHYSEHYFDSMDLFSRTLSKVLEGIKTKDTEMVEKYAREHIDEFVSKIKEELL